MDEGDEEVRVSVAEMERITHPHTPSVYLFSLGVDERAMNPIPPNKPFSIMCTVTYLFS